MRLLIPALSCLAFMPTTSDGFTPTPYRASKTVSTFSRTSSHWRRGGSSRHDRHNHVTSCAALTGGNDNLIDDALEKADLRRATNILRENPDTELSRARWNAIFSAIEETTANAEENTENIRQAAEFPVQSEARASMTAMYDTLKRNGQLKIYGAVDTKMQNTLLASGSHDLPPQLLESILEIPMKALTPKPTNSLLIAGVLVAVLEGVASSTLGISLNFLAFATLLAFFSDKLFLNGALSETFFKLFSPGVQDKILRHEAGHFLIAYLLGCPVEGIVLSAWAALQDRRFAARQVSAGTSFYDPDLSMQINTNGQLTRSTLDRYSIIVMAGIAAEAEQYGQADGGAGDEMALVAFLSQLNGNRPSSGGAWNSDSIRNQARWGALQAVLMMRHYKPAYDALVDALERGGSLGDCIYAIEKAARDNDLKPVTMPLGVIQEGGRWTTDLPPSQSGSAGREAVAASSASLRSTSQSSLETFNEEASRASLSQYRTEVENRLAEVERKLKELES